MIENTSFTRAARLFGRRRANSASALEALELELLEGGEGPRGINLKADECVAAGPFAHSVAAGAAGAATAAAAAGATGGLPPACSPRSSALTALIQLSFNPHSTLAALR